MRKSTLKITKTVSVLAVAGLVLAGCAEPRVEEPEAVVYPFAPLTGVAYMSESEIPDTNALPAVSCKVDNAWAGSPTFSYSWLRCNNRISSTWESVPRPTII